MVWIYNTIASILNSIASLWSNVSSLSSRISSLASQFVADPIGTAKALINQAIANVRAWAEAVFATASFVYRYVSDRLRDFLSYAASEASRLAQQAAEGIQGWVAANFPLAGQVIRWIEDRIAGIRGFVQTWVQPFLDGLRGDFAGLRKLVDQITADIWDGDIGKTIKALLPILESILYFFRNPLRAIRDLVIPLIITWVCSAAAHEIDQSIPLFGSLSGPGGGSGGGEIGGESPGLTGELAWPLDWLTISGNTWGVPPGHRGIDLALPPGKKIYAMHDGTVSIPAEMPSGYGTYCSVSGGAWRTLYGHGDRVIVADGAKVKRGQQVMIGDTTGRSTGDHLHLEIIYNGQYIDPVTVLPIPE